MKTITTKRRTGKRKREWQREMKDRKKENKRVRRYCAKEREGVKRGSKWKKGKKLRRRAREKRQSMTDWNRGRAGCILLGWLVAWRSSSVDLVWWIAWVEGKGRQEGASMMGLKTTETNGDGGKNKEATRTDDTWLGSQEGKGIKRATSWSWVGGNGLNCEQGGPVWKMIHAIARSVSEVGVWDSSLKQ